MCTLLLSGRPAAAQMRNAISTTREFKGRMRIYGVGIFALQTTFLSSLTTVIAEDAGVTERSHRPHGAFQPKEGFRPGFPRRSPAESAAKSATHSPESSANRDCKAPRGR